MEDNLNEKNYIELNKLINEINKKINDYAEVRKVLVNNDTNQLNLEMTMLVDNVIRELPYISVLDTASCLDYIKQRLYYDTFKASEKIEK